MPPSHLTPVLKPPTLSVVLPTFNCRPLMDRHLDAMEQWLDLAQEIIVVDSRSNDGTLDLIRRRLRHPHLRIIERDRGLYESWNEGIAATTGDWIYISTAGDTIERAHLQHLLELSARSAADITISTPKFVDEAGRPLRDLDWPPARVIADSGSPEPFTLTAEAGFILSYLSFPQALLGSSASNLYRGDHLRARPFPVGFKGAGDAVWILRQAATSRLCFTPAVGSTFCVHAKADQPGDAPAALVLKLLAEKTPGLTSATVSAEISAMLANETQVLGEVQAAQQARRVLWRAPRRTITTLYAWTVLTLTYAVKRQKLRRIRKRIRRHSVPAASYQRLAR